MTQVFSDWNTSARNTSHFNDSKIPRNMSQEFVNLIFPTVNGSIGLNTAPDIFDWNASLGNTSQDFLDWNNSSQNTSQDVVDYSFVDYSYESYAVKLSSTHFYPLEKVIYGYLFFPAAVIVLVINSLMLLVFFKGKFFNPANVLISAIAITDILTCVTPTPLFFYFYSLGNAKEFTPFNMCMLYDLLCKKIPRTFHTVSVWLTVGLAVQRYIVVSFPLKAKLFCNMKFSAIWIFMAYLLAFMVHAIAFALHDYMPVIVSSALTANKKVEGCLVFTRVDFFEQRELILNAYNIINGVFVHLAPCFILVILDILLVLKLRNAEKWRKETSDRKDKNANAFMMNVIIVWIVAAFLIVETPIAVGYLFQVTYTSIVAPPYGAPMENLAKAVTIMNYLIVLTSISNTVVYCSLSKRFRTHLMQLFQIQSCCKK